MARVAVIGASTSAGYLVPEQSVFTTIATKRLTQLCARPIDFQNLGVAGLSQDQVILRIDEALALDPAVLMWVLAPFDIQNVPLDTSAISSNGQRPTLVSRIHALATESRAVLVAQHYLYRNLGLYTQIYLSQPDRSDFLRTTLSPLWQRRLKYLEYNLTRVMAKAKAKNVPFYLVLVPQQAQAALAGTGKLPAGVDPFALGRALQSIVERHGGRFLDGTALFERKRWSDEFFYPVDGHLAAGGNRLIAEGVVTALANSRTLDFASCSTN